MDMQQGWLPPPAAAGTGPVPEIRWTTPPIATRQGRQSALVQVADSAMQSVPARLVVTDATNFRGYATSDFKVADQGDHRGIAATNVKFSSRLGPQSCSPPV